MSPSTESCSHHHDPGVGCHHGAIASDLSAQKVQRLLWVAALVLGFAVLELGVGIWSHSVALFADAGHLMVDCGAVLLALGAAWWGQRQPELAKAQQLEIWAALVNGMALVAIALWVGWEAIASLRAPPLEILSLPMLITAGLGLGVNSLNAKLLHQHSHDDLNVRGVLLHAIADAASSLGILLAALGIHLWHWQRADGAVGLGVAGLIILGAIPLINDSWQRLAQPQPHETPSTDSTGV